MKEKKKNKKRFIDTKFGKFLDKAKESVPEILNVGGKLLTGNIGGAFEEVSGILKEKAEQSEEAKSLLLEFEIHKMDWQKEIFELEVEDRKDARNLYSSDSLIQKALAILFTIAYFLISYYLFNHFITKNVRLSEFEIGFISTIFGGMSTKVNTIIDFFFGGSVK